MSRRDLLKLVNVDIISNLRISESELKIVQRKAATNIFNFTADVTHFAFIYQELYLPKDYDPAGVL